MLKITQTKMIILLSSLLMLLSAFTAYDQFVQDPAEIRKETCKAMDQLSVDYNDESAFGWEQTPEENSAIWWYLATELPNYTDC